MNSSIDNSIKMKQFLFTFLCFLIQFIGCFTNEPDYFHYLQQFGYAPKAQGRALAAVASAKTFNEGIKTFQRLYKLPVSLSI